jgi:2-polyprenyl-3-methyl-5-hydroxy-6-metoxy-1,4-benzoquinol methylase
MNESFDTKTYWNDRLTERFDLQGVGDIGLPVSYNAYLYRVRADAFRRVLKRLGGDASQFKVLDVGSGTGFYIDQWQKAGATEITGVDLTSKSVEMLGATFPAASFVESDIGSPLPAALAGRQFDVVSAYDMLFHIVDDAKYEKAIANFAELVRPGGHLVFSDNLSKSTLSHGPHQLSRAEAYVAGLLTANGFRQEAVYPMFVLMNDPVRSRNRILRKLFNQIYAFAARGEGWGRLCGAVMFPIELVLLRLCRRGPSTEIFVWRRNG